MLHFPRLDVDDITATLYKSEDELHTMARPAVEAFQLAAVRQRFEELRPKVAALASQADDAGITAIGTLADVVPLLFQHTTYKSYPASLIDKGRFDLLTRWLTEVTSLDLSGVDTSACQGIDDWLEALEQQSALMPFHTSGTSGKLSFFPRTKTEATLFFQAYLKKFQGFGGKPGFELGYGGLRLPVILPVPRGGRYVSQRLAAFLRDNLAPTPDQCYTLTEGTLSADLVALSGRVRTAQAKGDLSTIQLTDGMRAAFKRYLDELERRPEETAAFIATMVEGLKGQRVFMMGQANYLYQSGLDAAERGISNVFSPDSLLTMGGGGKGLITLPPDWSDQVKNFTGIENMIVSYGMSEITGTMSRCEDGYFHLPPYFIAYLLDPEARAMLPRTGQQTGRFACMDLLPFSYWGGIVSGDKVTIEWDRQCPCGRTSAHIHDTITRYSEAVTGDDKVTCAATVDNTDMALKQLLSL